MATKSIHGGFIFFQPVLQMNENGFNYIQSGEHIYPPFINPEAVIQLSKEWDTDEYDIFISSHQKTGTHLTKKYLSEVLRTTIDYPSTNVMSTGDIGHHAIPWPEVMVSQYGMDHFRDFINSTKGYPRVWYTHCAWDDLPFRSIHPRTKFIYVCRDPRGAFVSQYHFYRSHPMLDVSENLSMDYFLNMFIYGKMYFGDYHEQILEWINGCRGAISKDQLLVLRYEDLVDHKLDAARKLSSFLFDGLVLDEKTLKKVVETTEFETMKNSIIANPQSFHFNAQKFFREGKSKGWMDKLSKEQIVRINEKSEKVWDKNNFQCPLIEDIVH